MQNGSIIGFAVGCATGIAATLFYNSPSNDSSKQALASQCLGYKTWQDLTRFNKEIIVDEYVKGVKMDSMPNNLSDEQLYTILDELEQAAFHKCANKNLSCAETFLAKISKTPNVHEISDKKLYYETIHPGNGKQIESLSQVLCHYTIIDCNDTCIIDTRKNGTPKELNLAEVIPGLSMGMQGMHAGERRKLYVHPDFAYGSTHWIAPPQSLLIIDIEVME